MKHRILCLMLCFLLLVPVCAKAATFQNVQYVVDQADILTDQENIYLDNRAKEISSAYGVDTLVAIVEDMDGESAGNYAASLNGSRSWLDTDDAVLFLLALEEREWYIATFGTAISMFSDSELDSLGYEAAAFFSSGDFYGGFSEFLSEAEEIFIEGQSDGSSEGYVYAPERSAVWRVLPVSALVGLVVAGICLLVMRAAMNTKRRQRSAADYLIAGSFGLRLRHDIFLYSRVSKTPRQQNTGSGGSTVHRSSGGRSHGGRGGKF